MISNSLSSFGMAGLQSATAMINNSARSIANQSMSSSVDLMTASSSSQQTGGVRLISPTDDVANSLIEQKEGLTLFNANAKVINTVDEAVGSLLDMRT